MKDMHVLRQLPGFRRERGIRLANENDQKSSHQYVAYFTVISHV
jgi:hypothetical protein